MLDIPSLESSPADMLWKLRGLYSPRQVHLRRLSLLSLEIVFTLTRQKFMVFTLLITETLKLAILINDHKSQTIIL